MASIHVLYMEGRNKDEGSPEDVKEILVDDAADKFRRDLLEKCIQCCRVDVAGMFDALNKRKVDKVDGEKPVVPVEGSAGAFQVKEITEQETRQFYDEMLAELRDKIVSRPESLRRTLLLDLLSFSLNSVAWGVFENNMITPLGFSDPSRRILCAVVPSDSKLVKQFTGRSIANYIMTSQNRISVLLRKEKVDKVWAAVGYLDNLSVACAHEHGLETHNLDFWAQEKAIKFTTENVLQLLEVFDCYSNNEFLRQLYIIVNQHGLRNARDVLKFWKSSGRRQALFKVLDKTMGLPDSRISEREYDRFTNYLYSLAMATMFANKGEENVSVKEAKDQIEVIMDFHGNQKNRR